MASIVPTKGASASHGAIPFSLGMTLVTLGVVYGDIGTSPMYVMKAIISGNGGLASMDEDTVLGALSLVIWTVTLLTTVKYVLIAMRADNHNEGGIFALYSLVRRCGRYLILPAMVGGAALLADGILTPAVTVTTAIEGLRTIDVAAAFLGDTPTMVVTITVIIISILFLVQRSGTSRIGHAFGPVMLVWFLFLALTGLFQIFGNLSVFRALNPVRGLVFLFGPLNKAGFDVLGFVFLATTGAEALYADMGHVGKANIHASWPFVMVCLFLNYLGQGAWIIANTQNPQMLTIADVNPFFEMNPDFMRIPSVILATAAAIIASQALITSSYTLVSEAMGLDLMPHMRITYPSDTKGQLYIPMVNTIMWIGTLGVVFLFRTSERMEAAYGLAITVTMLMTSFLVAAWLWKIRHHAALAFVFLIFFGTIEACFFVSSLAKFAHGGYVTVFISAALFYVMYVWRRGSAIERAQSAFLPVASYIDQLDRLSKDTTVTKLADNVVFLSKEPREDVLDRDILYSILDKRPKRAICYYFVSVVVTDEPFTHTYTVNSFGTDFIFKVTLYLGFRVNQRINQYLRQVIGDLMQAGQIRMQPRRYSIYREPDPVGDFRFVMLRKLLTPETVLSPSDRTVMTMKYAIRRMCGSAAQWFGLQASGVTVEYVPLFARQAQVTRLQRIEAPEPEEALSILEEEDNDEVEEGDIISLDLDDETAESIAETEANVIGGEGLVDGTGVHPKILYDATGHPIGVARGHKADHLLDSADVPSDQLP